MTKLLQENEDLKEKSEEIREKNYLTEEERKKGEETLIRAENQIKLNEETLETLEEEAAEKENYMESLNTEIRQITGEELCHICWDTEQGIFFDRNSKAQRGVGCLWGEEPLILKQRNQILKENGEYIIFDIEQYTDASDVLADEIKKLVRAKGWEAVTYAPGYDPDSRIIKELQLAGIVYFVFSSLPGEVGRVVRSGVCRDTMMIRMKEKTGAAERKRRGGKTRNPDRCYRGNCKDGNHHLRFAVCKISAVKGA